MLTWKCLCLGGFGKKPQAGANASTAICLNAGSPGALASHLVLSINWVSATWTPGPAGDMPLAFQATWWKYPRIEEVAWGYWRSQP